jgi:hypothetical protein
LAERRDTGIEIIENPMIVLMKKEIEEFSKLQEEFTDLWWHRLSKKHLSQSDQCGIKLKIPNKTVVQWFRITNKCNEDTTCLFKNLEDCSIGRFFVKWKVKFEVEGRPIKKIKKEDSMVAEDEGIALFDLEKMDLFASVSHLYLMNCAFFFFRWSY